MCWGLGWRCQIFSVYHSPILKPPTLAKAHLDSCIDQCITMADSHSTDIKIQPRALQQQKSRNQCYEKRNNCHCLFRLLQFLHDTKMGAQGAKVVGYPDRNKLNRLSAATELTSKGVQNLSSSNKIFHGMSFCELKLSFDSEGGMFWNSKVVML